MKVLTVILIIGLLTCLGHEIECGPLRKKRQSAREELEDKENVFVEIDWNTVDFKEISLEKVKEISLTPEQLYEKIGKCVEKCLNKKNSNFKGRCLSNECDIYKK